MTEMHRKIDSCTDKERFFKTVRSGLLSLACMCLVFLDSQSAVAQTRETICRGLAQQLASLNFQSTSNTGNTREYRKYDDAVRKQAAQINKADRAMRRNGCRGIFKRTSSRCRSIDDSLKRMRANLAQLTQQRDRLSPQGGANSNQRRQILAAMDRNRCSVNANGQVTAAQPQKRQRRTLLEQIFGVRTFSDRGRRQRGNIGINTDLADQFNTFRTLCVRKSDGYYFPISFSTYYERLETDESLCLSMCPGSDVELYYHRMPVEDSEDMISYRSEIPYATQPFAFAYRREHNPENKCRFSLASGNSGTQQLFGNEIRDRITGEQKRPGYPSKRIAKALSPGDRDDQIAGLDVAAIKLFLESQSLKTVGKDQRIADANRKIRIVGPAFFPAQ